MPRKAQLVCMEPGCNKGGPLADKMPEARALAEAEGWQTGLKGALRIPGWEDDFCPEHAQLHPRIYCQGDRKPCSHRALYRYSRRKDGARAEACGSHAVVLMRQMIAGGNKIEVEEMPM